MADKQSNKTKRTVKNPETFRERALKANEPDSKPKRLSQLKQASGKLAAPAAKPAGKIAGSKPLMVLPRFLGKILVPPYIRSSWRELRQVTWPNWSESRRLTWAVLVFSVAFGLAIAGVDYVLDKIFREILLK